MTYNVHVHVHVTAMGIYIYVHVHVLSATVIEHCTHLFVPLQEAVEQRQERLVGQSSVQESSPKPSRGHWRWEGDILKTISTRLPQ